MIVAVGTVDAIDPALDWQRAIGNDATNEWAYSILPTADGGYMLAGVKSTATDGLDIYLVKASPTGLVEWERTYPGKFDDCAFSISEGQDGGFVLVGYTKSYGAGGSDVMLLKTDDNGEIEWNKTFGGEYNDNGQAVRKTADGGYIIVGTTLSSGSQNSANVFLIKTDVSGNLIWNRSLGGYDFDSGNSVQQTSDGGYIIAGETGLSQRDALLMKTNSSGYTVWSTAFGGAGSDYGYSVQQTSDGGFILAGATSSYGPGGENAYLVKTNSSGGLVWYNYYGGNSPDNARSVLQTGDGDYLFVGSTRSYGAGQSDVFFVTVSQSGDMVTMDTFGGLYDDTGYGIIEVGDGSCAIAGETRSFSTTLSQDIYLIKTNVFLDNVPPIISQQTPVEGAMVGDSMPPIGASFSDASGIDTTSVSVSLDSTAITSQCSITSDGFSYSPTSPLAEGIHTVTVGISDNNGNSAVYEWSFFIDTLSPIFLSISPANRSSVTSASPVINASFSDAGGIDIGGVSVRLDLVDVTASTVVTQTGIQYTPPSALNQGLHTATVIVRDLTGNVAFASWVFRIDTTPPTISALSPSNGANFMAFGETRVTISASYSDNAEISVPSIRLLLDGVDITPMATVTATALSYSGNVGPGSHTVQLTVADGAGNTSTASTGFTVTNLATILIIAIIIIVVIAAVLLLLLRRRKPKPPLQKWEQPPPPPPPATTYTPEPEIEAPVAEVKEVPPPPPPKTVRVYDSYTKTWFKVDPATGQKTPETNEEVPPPPPPEPTPEPQPQAPEAVEEPTQPAQPEEAAVAGPPPEPAVQEAPRRVIACPNCGASNSSTAAKCWYCERPLP